MNNKSTQQGQVTSPGKARLASSIPRGPQTRCAIRSVVRSLQAGSCTESRARNCRRTVPGRTKVQHLSRVHRGHRAPEFEVAGDEQTEYATMRRYEYVWAERRRRLDQKRLPCS